MARGRLKSFDRDKHYGFITSGENQQVFVHQSAFSAADLAVLTPGLIVEYTIAQGPKGPQAANARLVDPPKSPPPPPSPTPATTVSGGPHGTHVRAGGVPVPYHFVPIAVAHGDALGAAPVLHDGTLPPADGEPITELVSGEIRCTMTALTPLLVGNEQFSVTEVVGAQPFQRNTDHGTDKVVQLPSTWGLPEVDERKKVLEPLRLADGRVVIGSASLKGMLRQALGALLSAPMERVAERSYSYRPNLAIANNPRSEPRAAIIKHPPDKDGNGMVLDILPFTPHRSPDLQFLRSSNAPPGYTSYPYHGGADGKGVLAGMFSRGGRTYSQVAVSPGLSAKADRGVRVDPELVRRYWDTLDHLMDMEEGHISERHPLLENDKQKNHVKSAIEELRRIALARGTLIFVEQEGTHLNSIGHHFRYRWLHTGSVRRHWTPDGRVRDEVQPTRAEVETRGDGQHEPPRKLTGARLLFGYVAENTAREEHQLDERGRWRLKAKQEIGRGDFQHLAGRLAFNLAVEHRDDGQWHESRFLNAERDGVIPLKVLGMPRPSAYEHYLKQPNPPLRSDGGTLTTYGDVAGDDAVGDLNGRKFYIHQPDAATTAGLYSYTDNKHEHVRGHQAMIARFVSAPGTTFRFVLRFRDLRPWELGAVILALAPSPETLPSALSKDVDDYLQRLVRRVAAGQPAMAQKIGHGRPLGLGSVAIRIDSIEELTIDGRTATRPDLAEVAKVALGERLKRVPAWANSVLLPWLKVHQFAGRTRAAYPARAEKLGRPEEIFTHHTLLHREHAKGRRTNTGPSQSPHALKPLPEP